MRRDESIVVLGEDVGKKGGVFLATDGLWAEFGDDRVIDTPLTESMIVGGLDRRRRQRAAAGRRDPVRRLHLPGVQPDPVRGGADALPLEQRLLGADDDPRPVRRRRPRRALPLAVGRGVLHPHAGPQGRHPIDAVRRHGACCARRSATTTRCSSSSTRRCTARSAATCRTRTTRCRSGRPGHARGHADHRHRLRADGPLRARGGRARRGGGHQRRGRRPRTLRPLDGETLLDPCARPASAWSCTRTTASAATARRSPRSSPRRRSTTSMVPSPGSPGRTCRGAVQPRARGLVHAQPGEDRGRDPHPGRVLMPPLRRACSARSRSGAQGDPYEDALDARLGRRRPTASTCAPERSANGHVVRRRRRRRSYVSIYLMPIHEHPSCSTLSPSCEEADRALDVQLRRDRRAAVRRARGGHRGAARPVHGGGAAAG